MKTLQKLLLVLVCTTPLISWAQQCPFQITMRPDLGGVVVETPSSFPRIRIFLSRDLATREQVTKVVFSAEYPGPVSHFHESEFRISEYQAGIYAGEVNLWDPQTRSFRTSTSLGFEHHLFATILAVGRYWLTSDEDLFYISDLDGAVPTNLLIGQVVYNSQDQIVGINIIGCGETGPGRATARQLAEGLFNPALFSGINYNYETSFLAVCDNTLAPFAHCSLSCPVRPAAYCGPDPLAERQVLLRPMPSASPSASPSPGSSIITPTDTLPAALKKKLIRQCEGLLKDKNLTSAKKKTAKVISLIESGMNNSTVYSNTLADQVAKIKALLAKASKPKIKSAKFKTVVGQVLKLLQAV